MRIGVVAPSSPFERETAARVTALAAKLQPSAELVFHPQCFLSHNHFAGADKSRAAGFAEFANDPALDAIWFARGGYGACRMAEAALARLEAPAIAKTYLGYSDAGTLLAPLYMRGASVAHGPMCQDLVREGGEAAIARALAWLVERDLAALEPGLDPAHPHAAFNVMVLCQILGTPLMPDLGGHVLLLEEVSEHLYRIDRALFTLTSNPAIRKVAGIRLGRCGDIIENDPDFGMDAEAIAKEWCARSGIAWLGAADIGHDAANKVVPFGMTG
ncbi:MAG: LD-carboxypeptidase [Sphingomonadaceae bacterium]|nr:LD-carboxypeptidase [Sphingomonadaceae bacterium]